MPAFIQARQYTPGPRRAGIDLIVVHDMEAPEKGDTAEAVARYFARVTRPASAHWCFDSNSAVRCVRDQDIAYAAPGANHNGLQYELAGFAAQGRGEWLDPYGRAMLQIAAKQAAEDAGRYGIPVRFVTAAGLRRGDRGITTHAEVSRAFGRLTHTDPGAGFPMDHFLALIRAGGGAGTQAAPIEEETLMAKLTKAEKDDLIDAVKRGVSAALTVEGQPDSSGSLESLIEEVKGLRADLKAALPGDLSAKRAGQ